MGEFKIYRVKNLINGFCYIGATTKGIEKRKNDHEYLAIKNLGSNFQKAIGTFGPDAFSWEEIDTANSLNELAEKERFYIKEYNSIEQGYNSISGGGFKKTIYQYTDWGLLVGEWTSLSWAALSVLGKKKSISSTCLGYNKSYKGFYWSYSKTDDFNLYSDLRKKQVVKSDLNGNLLAIFQSVVEASTQTGVSKTCISRCCRGERNTSNGFRWTYE